MAAPVEAAAIPVGGPPGYPVPDAGGLSRAVLAAWPSAHDPKAARALVVQDLQAAKAAAAAGVRGRLPCHPRAAPAR